MILTGKLYYGIYILFIYPLIHSVFSLCFCYSTTDFVFDCCLSDYCNQRDNFKHVRYPFNFWFYFEDAQYYFGHEYEFTKEQVEALRKEMNKPHTKWLLRKKVSRDIHQDRLNLRVLRRKNASFCLKLAANYQQANRVRWMHTERVINTVYKYHSCTTLFAKTVFDNIVLLNNGWSNLNHIQAAAKKMQVSSNPVANLYKPFNQTFTYKKTEFIGIQEENIPSNFVPLIEKGVCIEPYDKNNISHIPVYKPQAEPDIVYIFAKSQFIEKRTHVYDQKTNNPGLGNNKLLSEITPKRFSTTIDRLRKEISKETHMTEAMYNALEQLKITQDNFEQHQIIWAQNLHLFPNNLVPPLKIPQNFSYAQLNPQALFLIKQSEKRLKLISDYLYTKKIPQINHGKFPKEALDLFEDSYIQKIMADNFVENIVLPHV